MRSSARAFGFAVITLAAVLGAHATRATGGPAPSSSPVPEASPTALSRPGVMTNRDIIALVEAGVGEEVILLMINDSEAQFVLDTPHVLELKRHEVPDGIITKMMERRKEAARSLKTQVQLVTQAMRTSNPETHRRAVTKGVLLGRAGVTLALRKDLLAHQDHRVRAGWLMVLGELRDERGLGPAMRLLTDPVREVRKVAAEAAMRLRDRRTVGVLIERLNEPEIPYDGIAIALGYIHDRTAKESLLHLASRNDVRQPDRAKAVWALSQLGDRSILPLFRRFLTEDRSPLVREAAAEALGRLRDPEAVEAMFTAYRRYPESRAACAIYLGSYRMGKVVHFLIRALRGASGSGGDDLSLALVQSLREITNETAFGSDAEEWEAWWERFGKIRPWPDDRLLKTIRRKKPSASSKPSTVTDPIAAVRRVLPEGWRVSSVRRGQVSPVYRPRGRGTTIMVLAPGRGPGDVKGADVFIDVMNRPYDGGGAEADPGRQTLPSRYIGENERWKVYAHGGWPGIERDLSRALGLQQATISPRPETRNPFKSRPPASPAPRAPRRRR